MTAKRRTSPAGFRLWQKSRERTVEEILAGAPFRVLESELGKQDGLRDFMPAHGLWDAATSVVVAGAHSPEPVVKRAVSNLLREDFSQEECCAGSSLLEVGRSSYNVHYYWEHQIVDRLDAPCPHGANGVGATRLP
jgi:hypothetical protein